MHEPPPPFALLNRPGCEGSWAQAQALHAHVKAHGMRGDWLGAAARFVDFFSGPSAWAAMPEECRHALAVSLPPNLHEWDAVMDTCLRLDRWEMLSAPALLVWGRDTAAPLHSLVEILLGAYSSWRGEIIPRGGHMAPLTWPQVFNALAMAFLDET